MADTNVDDRGEPDPLLAFFTEPATEGPSARPVESASAPGDCSELRRDRPIELRLKDAEAELAALRADLATLVSTVDDIKRRMSRRPEVRPVITRPPVAARPRAVVTTAAIVILGSVIGILGFRFIAERTTGAAELPPIQVGSSVESASPPVAAAAVVPPSPLVAAEVSPPLPRLAPPRDPPVRDQPGREIARRIDYVGTLSIDAEPGGQVFLNRKPVGRTPMRLESLRAGSHLIWIERDGYRRWTRVVQVPADRISRVSASLEPLPR